MRGTPASPDAGGITVGHEPDAAGHASSRVDPTGRFPPTPSPTRTPGPTPSADAHAGAGIGPGAPSARGGEAPIRTTHDDNTIDTQVLVSPGESSMP